jgi:hypothetical protein
VFVDVDEDVDEDGHDRYPEGGVRLSKGGWVGPC